MAEPNRGLWIMALAAIVATSASCETGRLFEVIGVTAGRDGTPKILWACPGDRIEHVSLVVRHGDTPWDGDEDILWKISSRGVARDTFVVGRTPPGFSTDASLVEELSPQRRVMALVEPVAEDGLGEGVEFEIGDLLPGEVVDFSGDALPLDDFRVRGDEICS